MKPFLNSSRWFIMAILSILTCWIAFSVIYKTDVKKEFKRFQTEFTALEKKQKEFKSSLKEVIKTSSIQEVWQNNHLQNSEFLVLLYTEDSLIYWNTNQISFKQKFAGSNSYFLGKFSNGYYLIDKFKIHDIQVYLGSKIKSEYYYHNEALQNKISPHFSSKNELEIDFKKTENNFPIYSLDQSELFFINFIPAKTIGKYKQLSIFLLYALAYLTLLIGVTHYLKLIFQKRKYVLIVFSLFLLAIRYFSVKYSWIQLFDEFELFDPNLYANSDLIPTLGSLILSLITIFIALWWVLIYIKSIDEASRKGTIILCFIYFGVLTYSLFVSHTFESFIVNSSIPLEIDEIFSLNIYSFILLFIIFLLFLSYYILILNVSLKIVISRIRLTHLSLLWFFSSLLFLVIELYYFEHDMLDVTWPVILNALMFYLAFKQQKISELRFHILILIVISFYSALLLFENNKLNEQQKRELYANQLVTDQDPVMELEYKETIDKLIHNPEFYQLLEGANYFSAPNFAIQLENCCFDEFWERYEIDFIFFQKEGAPLFEYISSQTRTRDEFVQIIKNHSIVSTIADELYYIDDFYDQISYIGYREIQTNSEENLDFFMVFRSKKIPESIGFPRLLMNEQSYALQNLEDYSIARFIKGKLVMRFGNYNYPTTINSLLTKSDSNPTFVAEKDYNHLIYKTSDNQGVIISKPIKKLEGLSTFSYLFLFFGIFSLISIFVFRWSSLFPMKTLQLSFKVQTVLVGMVVGTFLIFASIAIQNVRKQYNANTRDSLREKIHSVETVLEQRIGDKEILELSQHGDYLNFILKRLSNVFGADINFFDPNGKLFATSQAKIYDKGISSGIINNQAYFALDYNQKSEFTHHEQFGNLSFLSGYRPLNNVNGKLLGYINLQHFSKQNVFESQLNEFIISVINIAVLLLVLSVLAAILISGWITAPLRLIHQSFSKVEFGKENKPIAYKSDDEIGALVKDYNAKLAELELKAMQLAKSERETAWREMAKQIAHEIKNPLTPMKLSVQHFQRSFDPNQPDAKQKMERLVNSLIEQIDALSNIANEFSNFAKMPKANEENIDLVPLLKNTVDFYTSQDVEISLTLNENKTVNIFADKDLILRVFNNLIKNAIQASIEGRKTKIKIKVQQKDSSYIIEIQDNGGGIPDKIRDKMFVPNFTTKSKGSGLGLAMVKQIITSHNGDIWFTSTENKGTSFFVELPKNE